MEPLLDMFGHAFEDLDSYSAKRPSVETAMIEELKSIAAKRGAYIIFVQADTSIEDEPAIALCTKM